MTSHLPPLTIVLLSFRPHDGPNLRVGQPAAGLGSALVFLGQPGATIQRERGGGTHGRPGLQTVGAPGGGGREDTGGSVQ